MKTKLLVTLIFIIASTIQACELDQRTEGIIAGKTKAEVLAMLSKERYFPYQDIIINNSVLSKGVGPNCPSRYAAIKKALAAYDRPIKVLDIGASNGYFSLRIAHDFRAQCVMADLSDRLRTICELNDTIPNLIYLKRALSLEDLKLLQQQEHFDVILALNVVHHMEPWKEILDVIFDLGDTLIIETPPSNDDRVKETPSIPLIEDYLMRKQEGVVIAETPRAAANNFENIAVLNETTDALKKKEYTPNAFAKMFCFKKKTTQSFMPSFKVSTFKKLDGVFPSHASLDDKQEIVMQ